MNNSSASYKCQNENCEEFFFFFFQVFLATVDTNNLSSRFSNVMKELDTELNIGQN